MAKDFIAITDMSSEDIKRTINNAIKEKEAGYTSFLDNSVDRILDGKSVAMIFKKPSLRTRISFEIGVKQLGGHPLYITDASIGLGSREAVSDASRVLDRYVDMIVIRTFDHEEILQIAKWAEIPVINALTDLLHPCQIISDALTIKEHKGRMEDLKIAIVGDGANNIANSWLNYASRISIDLRIGSSGDRTPNKEILDYAKSQGKSDILITSDPVEAVKDADVIYTDVWASMGEKEQLEARIKALQPFQVNQKLMSHADKDAIFMHCLPAERGREVPDDVIDSPQSVVFDQAENRLHAQKGIIRWLFEK